MVDDLNAGFAPWYFNILWDNLLNQFKPDLCSKNL